MNAITHTNTRSRLGRAAAVLLAGFVLAVAWSARGSADSGRGPAATGPTTTSYQFP